MIFENVTELIGKTPLVRANNIIKKFSLKADLLLKLEFFNPAGSSKDRPAFEMIKSAIESGKIKRGATVIEPTSGNTGIGLAMVASYFGIRVVLVMPDTMSVERQKILRAYGAEIVLTPGSEGMSGAIKRAEEIAREIEGSFIPSQFSNTSNPISHYKTTAPEIFDDTDGEVDILVASVGTGGTLSGTGKFLKEKKPSVKVVAVEPYDSPLISKGVSSPHKIQGIGANFIPDNLDLDLIDEVLLATTDNSYEMVRLLAKEEGLLVGISSGAVLHAGIELAKREENEGKKIVAILSDTGMRYLSVEELF